MRSVKSSKRFRDPLDLEILEWIFESAWTTVQVNDPFRDFGKDEELKTALRRKLFALACVGMDDPDMLRSRLVAGMVSPPLAALTQIRP
jgi:hypothetical protein